MRRVSFAPLRITLDFNFVDNFSIAPIMDLKSFAHELMHVIVLSVGAKTLGLTLMLAR
jgi:hypothetical protein